VTAARRYAWWALSLLALGNLLNYLHRNVIFALFEPIKLELGVTDQQLGWLGSAYAIVFSVAALLAGVLADLVSRRGVLAGGLALWSGFTALGGAVTSYLELFVTRALVGVGQSAYLPAGQAMIADYFPRQGRAQAMGIFWVGLALGGVLAVWLGGALASAIGWRLTLVAVGLPGLLFAMLLTRLRDPVARTAPIRHPTRRRYINWRAVLRTSMPLLGSLALASLVTGGLMLIEPLPPNVDVAVFGVIAGAGALWSVLLWVRAVLRAPHLFAVGVPADFLDEMTEAVGLVLRTPTLIWLFIGGALTSAAMNALVAWSPSFLQRELGMTLLEAGQVIGPVGLIGAVLGSWSGGRLGDRLLERFAGGRVLASSLGFLIGAPICMWMLLVNDRVVFAALFLFVAFFYTWYNGPVAAALFDVVPRGIGGTVMGAYIFFIHIAGDAIALPVVGALSDRLGLRAALLSLPMVGLLGGVILLFALFTVRSDMARITPPTGA
jgi:MFS family permease